MLNPNRIVYGKTKFPSSKCMISINKGGDISSIYKVFAITFLSDSCPQSIAATDGGPM